MTAHDEVRRVAAAQHGLVNRRQATASGMTDRAVARAIERGWLEPLSPRVLRICGSAPTAHQAAMAATLDSKDGIVCLGSAVAMFGLRTFELEPVHVLTTRHPHRGTVHLGVVHSTTRISDSDRTEVAGIAVTTPLRTLFDLAGRLHPDRVENLCDDLLRRRLLRLDELHDLVAGLPRRGGLPRRSVLRTIVEKRPLGVVLPESRLERRFEEILADAGVDPFERQVDLGDGDGWIGRVDYADRACALVVEVQSETFHSSLTDRRRDQERIARLGRAGWSVLEVTENEIWRFPAQVVRRVRDARRAARGAAA
jgi:very-short-patch-repair endonuclease